MDYSLSQNLTLLRKNKQELLEKIDSMLDEPSGLTIESSWTEIETFLQNLNTYIMDLDGGVEEQMERFLTNNIETAVGINTTTVNAYSFYNKTSLGKVKIDTATTIGTNAFQGCTGLSEVNMSDVQSIGNDAFNGCTNLSVINAPSVTNIGRSSFTNTKLSDLSGFQTNKLTSIGSSAFQGCTKLTGDILLDGKTTIGASAFSQCSNIDRIIITNNVSVVNDTILYSSNSSARPSGYKLKYIACEQPSKPSSWGTYWNKVYGSTSSYQWPTYWNASIKDWVFVYNNDMPDTYWTGRVLEEFPNEGTKDGYTFEGWYSDPALTNKVSVPLTLATSVPGLYAKWLLDVTLMVYDLEALEWVNKGVYALGAMTDIPNKKILGYIVDKWYLDNAFTLELLDVNQISPDSPIIYASAMSTYSYDFEHTGTVQEIQLEPGKYQLECWGAQGGSYNDIYFGGKGGYSCGELILKDSTNLYIYVGEAGGKPEPSSYGTDRFGGGGRGRANTTANFGCDGGGASDIRIGTDSLYSRVIVAGGGGGGSNYSGYAGGFGGGVVSGGDVNYTIATQIRGGTSYSSILASAAFGQGGRCISTGTVAGGGGGWYGGGGMCANTSPYIYIPAGGGSGYVYTSSTVTSYPAGCLLNEDYYLLEAQTIAGDQVFPSPDGVSETGHDGNGYVRITKLKS